MIEMVEAIKTNEVEVRKNSLTFDDQVIKKITGIAANEVDGILALEGGFISGLTDKFKAKGDITKGINVEVGEKQVAIDLVATVEYGKSIPAIFEETVVKIEAAIAKMTGLKVVEVNLNVSDVKTKREFESEIKAEVVEPSGRVN
ncbi:Asp23/Gls24 family envelope stress response protein [Listeria sp. W9-0585]|uniref:Alkaline shock protein 23 n=2 Tax=Listeria rustica TaxID=2713503 RepID=A0A7W1T6L7_9LIST|nr:Asp23/Gls24 family envelope stress response protein [Listeria rustica]